MTCRHCQAVLSGKRQVCPEVCRSRKAPVHRCDCGRVMSARAVACERCQRRAYYFRRKARNANGIPPKIGRPPARPETEAEVERKLAMVDAMKRRARWVA